MEEREKEKHQIWIYFNADDRKNGTEIGIISGTGFAGGEICAVVRKIHFVTWGHIPAWLNTNIRN